MKLTKSQAEYLRAIYEISLDGEIKVTKIADYLNYKKPSVIRALKGLANLDLIVYQQKIKLTERGQAYAQNIVLNNQIIYKFLKDVLCIDEHFAKTDAENIKSSVSCYTIRQLEKYINNVLHEKSNNKKKQICQYEKCSSCQ